MDKKRETKSKLNADETSKIKAQEENKDRKKVLIPLFCLLGAFALAGAGVGIYFAVQPKAQPIKVDVPIIEGLTFKNQKAYIGQDYSTEISIDITKTGENRLPDELKLVKSGNRTITDTEYTYDVADNKESADFKIPGKYVEGDIKIDLELVPPGPTAWYLDNDYLNNLTPDDVTKEGGEVQTLKVNGLDHQVRLIGVNEDEDADGNTIHTTWEFVNLLSDENGYSLSTYWNDVNNKNTANHNYKDSTIRACLNGSFADANNGSTKPINWFQYFGAEHDIDTNKKFSANYSGKSVLSMLPDKFVSALKSPSKYININDGSSWTEETIEDKLFLLSPVEMGRGIHTNEEEHTTTYTYYKGTEGDLNRRKKHQINSSGARTSSLVVDDGSYEGNKYSYAGYNDLETNSNYMWLRSPSTEYNSTAWRTVVDGTLFYNVSYSRALAIAPAFCV